MYKDGMVVEYLGGRLYNTPKLEKGMKGKFNKNLCIEWENGIVSLPIKNKNVFIKVIYEPNHH